MWKCTGSKPCEPLGPAGDLVDPELLGLRGAVVAGGPGTHDVDSGDRFGLRGEVPQELGPDLPHVEMGRAFEGLLSVAIVEIRHLEESEAPTHLARQPLKPGGSLYVLIHPEDSQHALPQRLLDIAA